MAKFAKLCFLVLVFWALSESPAAAQAVATWKHIGAGFGAGITIVGAAFGISQIGARAVESMARQPEVATQINGAMIVSAALIEGVTFLALIVCLLALFFN